MKPVRAQAEVEKIKENILIKALDVIVSEGFEALTMRRLAREIGMTAPNIYNYFSNKDEIYITLMIRGFEKLSLAIDQEMATASDPYESARAFMQTYIKFGLENNSYYEIMFTSSSPKYKDYVGTTLESLSSQEHEVSMSLAMLALKVIQNIAVDKDRQIGVEKTKFIMTTLWSLLHGMVGLYNSQNIFYVVDNAEALYSSIIESVMDQVDSLVSE